MTSIARPLSRVRARALPSRTQLRWGARWQSTEGGLEAQRKWSTPLAKHLGEAIRTTGPIPVAAYMRQCLTGDGGYYTSRTEEGDQFGKKGDFITSPEISQIFGELVGLWVYMEWAMQKLQGRKVNLIEVGPGRGTLMDDMLRTLRNLKSFSSSIDKIYLVEASKPLREAQHKLLCGDSPLEDNAVGYRSRSKYSPSTEVIWCEDMKFVPQEPEAVPFIIAHEFFDALPIHIFHSIAAPTENSTITTSVAPTGAPPPKKPNEWREMLVNPVSPYDAVMNARMKKPPTDSPDFELIVSQKPTPHSQLLPKIDERYQKLLPHTGSVIEISPESLALVADFSKRIAGVPAAAGGKASPAGAALILDYGPSETIPTNSLRGIRAHKAVSPFTAPGSVDLSVDVDFLGLANAALDASPNVEVHGPTEQAAFLGQMGIKERAEQLIKKAGGDEEVAKRIEGSARRLVDRGPDGMGKTYKALSILPHFPDKKMRRPVGFGGSLNL